MPSPPPSATPATLLPTLAQSPSPITINDTIFPPAPTPPGTDWINLGSSGAGYMIALIVVLVLVAVLGISLGVFIVIRRRRRLRQGAAVEDMLLNPDDQRSVELEAVVNVGDATSKVTLPMQDGEPSDEEYEDDDEDEERVLQPGEMIELDPERVEEHAVQHTPERKKKRIKEQRMTAADAIPSTSV